MSDVHGFAGGGLGGGSSVEETEEESDDDDIGEDEPPAKQVCQLTWFMSLLLFTLFIHWEAGQAGFYFIWTTFCNQFNCRK